jgi:hypothetical protein
VQDYGIPLAGKPTSYRRADAGRGASYEGNWRGINELGQRVFSILRLKG